MNRVIFKGRLTKDPEMRQSNGAEPVDIANFSIAVNRRFKREGQPDADFFNCVAFGKTGGFIGQYFKKGQEILLEGSLQNRSWEDTEGNKRYATDVVVENAEFCGSKADNEARVASVTTDAPKASNPTPPSADEESDDDLPF